MVQSEQGKGVIQDGFGEDIWIQRIERKTGENLGGVGVGSRPTSVASNL